MNQKSLLQNRFCTTNSHSRPKLDYLVKKDSQKDIFVPFTNERDGMNRLLAIIPKNKEEKNENVVPEKGNQSNAYITYKSNKLEINQKMIIQELKKNHPSFFTNFLEDQNIQKNLQNFKTKEFESLISPKPFVVSPPRVEFDPKNVENLIFRNKPNFSFSKTIQKTIIEKTIEEGKKHDYCPIDAGRALEFLLKKGNYIPNYAKECNFREKTNKAKSDNHEYLMKLLSQNEDNITNSDLNRTTTLLCYQ